MGTCVKKGVGLYHNQGSLPRCFNSYHDSDELNRSHHNLGESLKVMVTTHPFFSHIGSHSGTVALRTISKGDKPHKGITTQDSAVCFRNGEDY